MHLIRNKYERRVLVIAPLPTGTTSIASFFPKWSAHGPSQLNAEHHACSSPLSSTQSLAHAYWIIIGRAKAESADVKGKTHPVWHAVRHQPSRDEWIRVGHTFQSRNTAERQTDWIDICRHTLYKDATCKFNGLKLDPWMLNEYTYSVVHCRLLLAVVDQLDWP